MQIINAVMKIYLFDSIEELGEDFVKQCVTFFPSWRTEQMMAYKHHSNRVRNAVAYLLLVKGLKDIGVMSGMPEFDYNEHGKPFLKNYPGWYFNISHCKTAVVCVLSRKIVGIDVEDIGKFREQLAKYSFNDDELKMIYEGNNTADMFYKLWTQKEAVFKCLGIGITHDIKNVLVNNDAKVISLRHGNIWISLAER